MYVRGLVIAGGVVCRGNGTGRGKTRGERDAVNAVGVTKMSRSLIFSGETIGGDGGLNKLSSIEKTDEDSGRRLCIEYGEEYNGAEASKGDEGGV